ncbi:uncharacterized protein TNCT_466101 [Trichonephila clavata]|uniref:Uncharacterized protein n=1 Tax=Trichonephila clavata TaxID=2740835 RepID=A0A8X6L7Z1_TRICU|nr:uncharacterized protein TNCT_466101 [Trichonephila clavata]
MTLQTPIVVPYCYQVTGKRLCESSRLPYEATGHPGGPSRLPGSIPIKEVPLPLFWARFRLQQGISPEIEIADHVACQGLCSLWCSARGFGFEFLEFAGCQWGCNSELTKPVYTYVNGL